MFTKNIYLLYPSGYCGTYLNWILHKSELDTACNTVDNPINKGSNDTALTNMYGGPNTAHLHRKTPSHQTFYHHLRWVLYNKPDKPRIYSIGAYGDSEEYSLRPAYAIQFISRYDPQSFFINLHHGGDDDVAKIGALNSLHKWPVSFVASKLTWLDHQVDGTLDHTKIDLSVRNQFVDRWRQDFYNNGPLNKEEVNINLEKGKLWFETRRAYSPNEILPEEYLVPDINIVWENFVEYSLLDILQDNFVDKFEQDILKSNIGNFDFSHAKKFHHEYVASQYNATWLTDIKKFRLTSELTDFLLYSNLSQAFIVEEVLPFIPKDVTWRDMTTEDIVNKFYLRSRGVGAPGSC